MKQIRGAPILFVWFILLPGFLISQGANNKWYFGDHAGLDFNSGAPVAITSGQLHSNEGCSSISDNSGNLLFYTNGVTVWNKLNIVMPNGTGLMGDISTTQSALIVKNPGNPNQYYIFTLPPTGGSNGMRYSMVDMTLASGNGDVTAVKNIPLHATSTEKVAAYARCDGSIWVLSHEWNTNTFFADLVTTTGISPSVTSSVGVVHTGGIAGVNFNAVGCMKISQQGNRIALAIRDMDLFEVFDFDVNTGVVSSPITLTSSSFDVPYGVEFSPDGTKLYGSSISPPRIFQFNITLPTAATILSSMLTIAGGGSTYVATLQLGPDNKIYVAREFSYTTGPTSIGVINNPNVSGIGCGYSGSAISLAGKKSLAGLQCYVVSPPVMTTSVSGNVTICQGQSTVLSANGGTIYSWSGGVSASTASVSVSPSVTTDYFVSISNGCTTVLDTVTVSVDNPINISIAGADSICTGQTVVLTGTGSPAYTWSGGASSTSSTVSISPLATTTYFLTGASNVCGTDTDTLIVYVQSPPAIIASADVTLCSGQTTTLSASGSSTYTWSGGISASTASVLVSPSVDTDYFVSASNGCGTDADTITVSVDNLVNISISGTDSICTGQTVVLTGTGSPAYTWSGGTSSTSSTVSISPLTTTTYFLTGASNACGADTDTLIVYVQALPAIIASADVTLCSGQTTTLTASGSPTYTWSGGVSASTASVVVSPSVDTDYFVSTSNGCGTDADTITVSVDNPININISGSDSICTGQTVLLTGTGSPAYTWSGGASSTSSTVSISPLTTTTYFLTGASNACGSDTDTLIVYVQAPPAIIASADVTLCSGQTTTLTASGSTTYTWSGGISASTASVIVSPSADTDYFVSASNGCGTDADTITVSVDNPINISISGVDSICAGQTVVLTGTGSPAYTWSGGSSSTSASITVSPLITTSYYLTGALNACGSDTDTLVVFTELPPALIVSADSVICLGESITLSASGATTYLWSGGVSSASPSVTVSPILTTDYFISGSGLLCATDVDTIVIAVVDFVSAEFSYSLNECNNQVSFQNLSDAALSYSWSFGNGTFSSVSDPFTVFTQGVYNVVFTTNPNLLCADSVQQTIAIIGAADSPLFIPNVFTPNGDGKNDEFKIGQFSLCSVYHLVIFNRWGQKMFDTDTPDTSSWNGVDMNGKAATEGIYSYIVSVTDQQNNTSVLTGFVSLTR